MQVWDKILDENGICIDVSYSIEGKSLIRMLGSAGERRELAILPKDFDHEKHLPVFLGYGMGYAVSAFQKNYPDTPIAVVDKELELWEKLGHTLDHNTLFLQNDNVTVCLGGLSKWQSANENKPFYPIIHPFYQRIDKEFYGNLREKLLASKNFDFWGKSKYAKFQGDTTRLLLISSKYFLLGEVERACKNLGVEFRHLQLDSDDIGTQDFIEQLLKEIINFKPDAMLTMNHSGIDLEGVLANLLEKLELPLISWFLDNPHLVLASYAKQLSPWVHIFTWDMDNIESLKAKGFPHVHYLPLGTDPDRFNPSNINRKIPAEWKSDVSFVGNSMVHKIFKCFGRCGLEQKHLPTIIELGQLFSQTDERDVNTFIFNQKKPEYQDFLKDYKALKNPKQALSVESAITWEATRYYRFSCVAKTLTFNPLIVGDDGWMELFGQPQKSSWRWHDAINYYEELPYFYGHSLINFNCTSMQMKGATNQRILDVPAAGAFVLTEWREQLPHLFEVGKEIICYNELDEIPDLIRFYLKHDNEREKIVQAGRKRVLSCHTWEHRVQEIIKVMREKYGL